MKIKLLSLISALALVACAAPVTPLEIQQAQFPAQPHQAEINNEVGTFLKANIPNPEAARKECSPPRKAWARQQIDKPANFGWMVVCDVNAKNNAGAYVGTKPYMFLFTKNGNMTYDPSTFVDINDHVQFLDLIAK